MTMSSCTPRLQQHFAYGITLFPEDIAGGRVLERMDKCIAMDSFLFGIHFIAIGVNQKNSILLEQYATSILCQ